MRVNTRVEFEWDNEAQKYVEISSEGYDYDGPVARADENEYENLINRFNPSTSISYGGSRANPTGNPGGGGAWHDPVSKGPLGTFWDTHLGREGFVGWIGDISGLWKSGTTKDAETRARNKIKEIYGGAISDTEDFMANLENYYQGEGGLIGRTRQKQAMSSKEPSKQMTNLINTVYSKSDFGNVEAMETPDLKADLYAAADLGMQNSILGQKFQMDQQIFNLEEKIKQLEMGQEDRLNQIT